MADFLTTLGDLYQERMVPTIEDLMPGVDPIFSKMVTSSERVRQDEITKGYKAIHTFVTSVAGAIRYGGIGGPDVVANVSNSIIIDAHQTYPTVDQIPTPGIQNRYITIGRIYGNIPLSLTQLRNQQLDTLDNWPAILLKQVAKHVAHNQAVAWYTNDSGQVVELDDVACTLSGSNHIATLTETGGGNVVISGPSRRLMPGIQYDIYAADMLTKYTTNSWVMLDSQVDFMDPTTITLFFNDTTDATTFDTAATGTAHFYLVPYSGLSSTAANASRMPCGYKWWMRETGTLFGSYGDLTVENFGGLFKSKVTAVGGALTVSALNAHISAFEAAKDVQLDTILTTPGVIANLLDQYGMEASTPLVRFQEGTAATGAMDRKLGWRSISYTFNGREFEILQSPYMTAGEVIVLKTRDGNLCRYEPGRLPGSNASPAVLGGSKVGSFDPRMEWLGPVMGSPTGIWMPANTSSGARTNGAEAPFDIIVQHAAQEVRGIQFTGCTETTP